MNANENQVAGTHYKTGGVQHWDFVAEALKARYFEGNITKYVTRYKKKNGLLDVQKAIHYCDKLRELYAAGKAQPLLTLDERAATAAIQRFCDDAELDYWQKRVMVLAATWRDVHDLAALRACL